MTEGLCHATPTLDLFPSLVRVSVFMATEFPWGQKDMYILLWLYISVSTLFNRSMLMNVHKHDAHIVVKVPEVKFSEKEGTVYLN